MTRYIDLASSVRWSEADIVNRMEAQIRGTCPASEELILHRKMIGAAFELYDLTPAEMAEIQAYAQVCSDAQTAGRQARLDAALLNRVLDAEEGIAPLSPDDSEGQALLASRLAARPVEVAPITPDAQPQGDVA